VDTLVFMVDKRRIEIRTFGALPNRIVFETKTDYRINNYVQSGINHPEYFTEIVETRMVLFSK